MNIEYLENNKIIFKKMQGDLMNDNEKFIKFVNDICGINTKNYDYIYELHNDWTGGLLLVKGNRYTYFKFGSGRPIITESKEQGMLNNSSCIII